MPNFTGGVKSLDAKDLRTVRFQYEPGARSYWHVHDGIQVLMIEKGRGRMPGFGHLPKDTIGGLAKLVLMLSAPPSAPPAPPAAGSAPAAPAAPPTSGSAAPPASSGAAPQHP